MYHHRNHYPVVCIRSFEQAVSLCGDFLAISIALKHIINMVTTCDFLINFISAAGGMESFLAVPTNTENVLHFTDHDERDIYAAVDVDQNSELRQDGKVVVITGAGR